MEIFGHIFSNVSKSLDSYCCALLDVILFCHFEKDIIPSKGGRCFPPEGTSKMYRFSCDDSRILFSGYLIVLVHHPSHDRCIGVDVRSRDILVRADKVCHCFYISPAQMFKLMGRELLWINRNPSLGAAIRDICHSAFECHPECKRLYLILADIWMITDAALCWPEDIIIMDAYRWIDIDGLVIHGDSKVSKKYLFWVLQYFFLVIPQRNERICFVYMAERVIEHFRRTLIFQKNHCLTLASPNKCCFLSFFVLCICLASLGRNSLCSRR